MGCPLLPGGGDELSADSCELLLGGLCELRLEELSELLEGGGFEGLLGGGLLLGLEGEEALGGGGG